MQDKAEDTFRFVQLNVGNMAEKRNSAQFRAFTGKVEEVQADCVACQELNCVWHRLPEADRLYERFRGVFEAVHLCEGRYHNDAFARGSHQYGGTMVMSVGPAAHAIHSVGYRAYDPKGLGRWSATRFAGKYGKALRVISAYRPNRNKGGELSVYAQHLAKLAELNNDRDPLKAFDEDLYDAISEWRDEDDSIILGIDFNDDVRARSTTERFESLQMMEVLLERHGFEGP